MTGMKNVSSVCEGQFWLAMMHWNKVWIIILGWRGAPALTWSMDGFYIYLIGVGSDKKWVDRFWINIASRGKTNPIVLSDLQLLLNLGLAFY